ncbi:MAG: DUF4243 domain-containing protein [Actinophytocola sp.]|uniref:questin oxidase family protein n=1 Tax=Actinophytocola sp. TaxID=1872138 RepID=UPI00132B6683|nr:questin oxidase family protein [Actinophytocola sp.]MPZ79996.1 DUF4243 domain-containing protein [Actinophytocola sp.]
MDETLTEAYERLHHHGPEFGGDEEGNHGLTNHGPMAAEVIVRRGLDIDVQRWLDRYIPRLAELPVPGERITESTWRAALGDGRRVGDWTAYFSRQLAERPWRQVLETWWPRLLPGIAAGSTHGVIRVSHAVRVLSGGEHGPAAVTELGYGLAFWAARFRTLPGFTAPVGALPAADALRGVPRLAEQSGLIAHRLSRLADLPGWSKALAALRAPTGAADVPALLADLVDTATLHYLTHGQGSPVLLVHTATAPNAVRHVLPALPEGMWIPSLVAAWAATAAITAAYSPADPARPPGVSLGADPSAEALDRAASHYDEHVIKFTDTAVDVFERTENPDALAAAVRAGQLIDSPR